MILAKSLLPMKQGFYKAICTCTAMGLLNAKFIMTSNDKKMRVEVCCHGKKVLTEKSHTMHYYCSKRHKYRMSSKEAVRVSPCCHGNEVSVVTGHTIDQYCAKGTVNQRKLTGFKKTKLSRNVLFAITTEFP